MKYILEEAVHEIYPSTRSNERFFSLVRLKSKSKVHKKKHYTFSVYDSSLLVKDRYLRCGDKCVKLTLIPD